MPRETLDAFRDHGKVADTVEQDIPGARAALAGLAEVGIDMKQVTDQLEKEGVDKFAAVVRRACSRASWRSAPRCWRGPDV